MNKILNWTIGSFFRTIGRIIAYIGIGIVIAYILNSGNFDWGGITELFFDKVDALSITDNVQSSGSDYFTITNPNDFIAYNDFYYTTISSGWIDRIITYELSPRLTLGSHDYVEIPFITSYPSQTEVNYPVQDDFVTCRTWTCDTYSQGVCGQFKCISWYTSGTSTTNDHMLTDYEVNGLSFYAKVVFADSQGNWAGWHSCSIQGNSFICSLEHDKYLSYIQVVINYNPPKSSQFYFGLQRGVNYYRGQQIQQAVEQNTQAINDQTQQQQQQHEELMDSNTTQANSQGEDFINNFSNNTHGLTGIITAPLNAIQSIASSTCSTLVLPLPFTNNKTLSLPCMSTIYSQHFGVFYTMYQGIILALISYWVCVRLFTLAKGFKDPEDDKIEVMDL